MPYLFNLWRSYVEEAHQFDSKPLRYFKDLNQDWCTFLETNGLSFNNHHFEEDRDQKIWIFVTTKTEQAHASAQDIPAPSYTTQKPFLDRIRSKSYPPPSTAAKDSHLQRRQRVDNQAAFYNSRPATLTGPPLGVYHPVFVRFLRLVEEHENVVLTSKHLGVATELIDASTELYGNEKERQDAIRRSLETFIEDVVDPIRRRSCMPAFLVAIAGPNLAIGGALLLDRPVIELLTPWIPLRYRPTAASPPKSVAPADDQIRHIARVMVALRMCSHDLRDYYKKTLESTPDRAPFAVPWPHLTKIGNYEIEYQERLWPTPSRCLFRARATRDGSAISVIVKFTHRYCREAHIVVSNHGAAPQLLHCDWDETVGQMVVMWEYVDATKVDDTKQQLNCDQSIRRLEDAVKAMHEAGFVHGDLREPNILLDGNNAPMIIDFDWAGPMDDPCTVYPSNICLDSSYNLHEDVCAGGRILAEHDDHLVKNWSRQAQSTGL
ncbi:hypothetical protein BKA62DRAFT_774678 [Auriculariales sp. MPI-PUGE-AT-0066]|nr:hypothetical protein BKA62DRAFT_774678 [Auriculariales sp. MPI-PUGE-AT-0066]